MSGTGSGQPSTVKSYIDSGVAAVQGVVGSLTGNPVDKREAEGLKVPAQDQYDASHVSGKVGSYNISSSGATTVDNEDRIEGKQDQLVGSGKEFVGNALGSKKLKCEGEEQNERGQGKEASGQIMDYVGGIADRVTGTVGGVTSSLLGNENAQAEFSRQHDTGKTNQRSVESEME
ncbi:hypothetical protein RUND412_008488 [Rhizina undulata]